MSDKVENISNLDLLKSFADSSNRKIFTEENVISVRHGITKRIAYIETPNSNVFLFWYNNPNMLTYNSFYSGAGFEIDLSQNCYLSISGNNIWKRIANSFSKKKIITDNKDLNTLFIIKGENFDEASKILENKKIQEHLLELFKIDERISVYINSMHQNFIPKNKTKATFSIVYNNNWEMDFKKIEKIFELAGGIEKAIKNG